MHDLIILGGGPAGLAALAQALDKQLDAVLVCPQLGGKVAYHIETAEREPQPVLGADVVARLTQRLAHMSDRVISDQVVGIFKRDETFHVLAERRTLHAPAVVLATGAQPTMLSVPNETRYVGHGLGYSVLTHARRAAGQDVAVIGATARAQRGIAELLQTARSIAWLVHDHTQVQGALAQRLSTHPIVRLLIGYRVTAITGDDVVRAIEVQRGDDVHLLPIGAVFVSLRLVPNTQMVRQVARLDDHGHILVDAAQQSSLPGLFAAGDVTQMAGEHIFTALGDGARAALHAYEYILAQRLADQQHDQKEVSNDALST